MTTKYPNAIDKKIKEWEQYYPPQTARPDLEVYWRETLKTFAAKPLNGRRTEVETPLAGMTVYDVTYEGFDDTPIHGWLLLPAGAPEEKLPCVVVYHGYSGSRGYPEQHSQWVLMGFAVFAIDIRGQGGATGNLLEQSFGMTKGWITQGLLYKDKSYYKAITIDSLKAVEWVKAQPEIDGSRLAVTGGSQGGGLALIVGALSADPALIVANIPNMCHMDLGLLNSTGSLTEAARFVHFYPDQLETVLETLSYFDLLNLGEWIQAPVLVSVGLKDTVCLPETVFAAYNRIRSPKQLEVYPFAGHEVNAYQNRLMLEFVKSRLGNK